MYATRLYPAVAMTVWRFEHRQTQQSLWRRETRGDGGAQWRSAGPAAARAATRCGGALLQYASMTRIFTLLFYE